MRIRRQKYYFAITIFLITVLNPLNAYAQKKNISNAEKGVLAYYAVTGIKPNINHWVMSSKEYQDRYNALGQQAAAEYLNQEKLRYQWGLGTFDPKKNFLEIKTQVDTELIEKDGKLYMASQFPGRGDGTAPYFPYNIQDTWVALIIKNIDKYMVIEIPEKNKSRILGYLTSDKEKHSLEVTIRSRIISGDKSPITLDGQKQNIMLGEVAHIAYNFPDFHQSYDKLLWEYYASWYLNEDKQDLLKILDSRNP